MLMNSHNNINQLIITQYQNKVAQNILALYLMTNLFGSLKLKIW